MKHRDLRDEWEVGTEVSDDLNLSLPGVVMEVTKRRLTVNFLNGKVERYDAEHTKFLRRKLK